MDRVRNVDANEIERFVASLEDYQPVIPDELVRYYLAKSGFQCDDVRVERLVALAAQKFLADITSEALAHCKLRQAATSTRGKQSAKHSAGEQRIVLTPDKCTLVARRTEDLERALREYGVHMQKPPYYTDSVSAFTAEAPKPSGGGGGGGAAAAGGDGGAAAAGASTTDAPARATGS